MFHCLLPAQFLSVIYLGNSKHGRTRLPAWETLHRQQGRISHAASEKKKKISIDGINGKVRFLSAQLFLIFRLYQHRRCSLISSIHSCWSLKGKLWLWLKANCEQAVTQHLGNITEVCSMIHLSIMFQTYSNTLCSCLSTNVKTVKRGKPDIPTRQSVTNCPKTFLNNCVHPGRSFLTNCTLTEGGARLVFLHVFCP